jgi:hypothetical protein
MLSRQFIDILQTLASYHVGKSRPILAPTDSGSVADGAHPARNGAQLKK